MGESQGPFLFVGLGNPGDAYECTRHNMGALVVQGFAKKRGWLLKSNSRFSAAIAKGEVAGQRVHLLFPETYMNLSGTAVRHYLEYLGCPTTHCMVIVDDVALPFGKMRLRDSGTSGGHNGLKSIEFQLGTQEFVRLRMGIGAPDSEKNEATGDEELASYVLARFSEQEMTHLDAFIKQGIEILELSLTHSWVRLVNAVNRRKNEKTERKPL